MRVVYDLLTGRMRFDLGGEPSGNELYRCASVDTETQTWTGYKAVKSSGVYAFESAATEGLAYGVVTPVVGQVYDASGLIAVNQLYQGFPYPHLAYPMESLYDRDNNPMATLTATGVVSFAVGKHGNCAAFGSSGKLSLPAPSLFSGATSGAVSLWLKRSGTLTTENLFSEVGSVGNEVRFWLCIDSGKHANLYLRYGPSTSFIQITSSVVLSDDAWHHVFAGFDGTNAYLVVDGTADQAAFAHTLYITSYSRGEIGGMSDAGYNLKGYIDELCIWNKNVSDIPDIAAALYAGGTGRFL